MSIRANFFAVFSYFRFASIAENPTGEDEEEFFCTCECFSFPYALPLDVDLIDKRFVVFAKTN